MKLAISGKGGVGKTLFSAMLARTLADTGYAVTAIDADPDANLALTLGIPEGDKITPISEMKELVAERTETRPGQSGLYFKINPRVDDIPEKYSVRHGNIRLLKMGMPKAGGAGCYCPENALLSALMAHLLLTPADMVIMDMAAGIEHLNRGTARAVDMLIIVVEPGKASLETARRIRSLAGELGITRLGVVGNKIRNSEQKDFISASLEGYNILGFIPYDEALAAAEIAGRPVLSASKAVSTAVEAILAKLTA
jgi:CO dehydrogenase maturation factor